MRRAILFASALMLSGCYQQSAISQQQLSQAYCNAGIPSSCIALQADYQYQTARVVQADADSHAFWNTYAVTSQMQSDAAQAGVQSILAHPMYQH